MVIYRGSDGKPGYHQVDDIHDAVSFVEEMRNQDGVDHARIFRLEEVTFEFKPYYRVEIGNGTSAAVTAAGETSDDDDSSVAELAESDDNFDGDDSDEISDDSSDDEVAQDSDASDEAEEDAGSGARRGLFGR